jgi:hypothetical protein
MEPLLTAWFWVLVFVIALCASGVIQWLKGLAKKAPGWIWSWALPALCLALALAWLPWPLALAGALLAMVIAQLGYDLLLQALIAWVRRTAGLDVTTPATPAPSAAGPSA